MSEVDTPYPLDAKQITSFRENGYVRLKHVLSDETLAGLGEEVTRVVRETESRVPHTGGTYARAFTQRPNLWRRSGDIAAFVRSQRLARIATELMGVEGVRLYHDQALYKEAHGGHTPWHCDQYYWPLSNEHTITAWIPFQAVPSDMGPVAFAKGSHRLDDAEGRSLAISDASEETLTKLLEDFEVDARPFELGEVSLHSGWTFHRAEGNVTADTRGAFTIIYMDRDIRATEPQYPAQAFDLKVWLPGIEPGQVAASPINPILYER